jgi:hypothetical protein
VKVLVVTGPTLPEVPDDDLRRYRRGDDLVGVVDKHAGF